MKNNDFWKKRKIFSTITTINNSDWRKKVKEAGKLKLKEVCLFLTCLEAKERKGLYQLLKETEIEKIPLVHLKDDMELWELDYLVKYYKTEAFNIHTLREYPLAHNLEKYKNIIYIENTVFPLTEEEIKNSAGICLDVTHLENNRLLHPGIYKQDIKIIEKYYCGCNHISAVKPSAFFHSKKYGMRCDSHYLENLSELDYLKKYPAKYFSPLIAIELENSLEEQLKAKDYIIDLMRNSS